MFKFDLIRCNPIRLNDESLELWHSLKPLDTIESDINGRSLYVKVRNPYARKIFSGQSGNGGLSFCSPSLFEVSGARVDKRGASKARLKWFEDKDLPKLWK